MSVTSVDPLMVRPTGPEDGDALAAIKSRAWGSREVESWRRRWRWQFLGHPGASEGRPTFLVVESEDCPSGGIGWKPAQGVWRGWRMTLAFACDIFVDLAFQGSGMGRAHMDTVAAQAEVTLFMNPSRAMRCFLRRHGYGDLDLS